MPQPNQRKVREISDRLKAWLGDVPEDELESWIIALTRVAELLRKRVKSDAQS